MTRSATEQARLQYSQRRTYSCGSMLLEPEDEEHTPPRRSTTRFPSVSPGPQLDSGNCTSIRHEYSRSGPGAYAELSPIDLLRPDLALYLGETYRPHNLNRRLSNCATLRTQHGLSIRSSRRELFPRPEVTSLEWVSQRHHLRETCEPRGLLNASVSATGRAAHTMPWSQRFQLGSPIQDTRGGFGRMTRWPNATKEFGQQAF